MSILNELRKELEESDLSTIIKVNEKIRNIQIELTKRNLHQLPNISYQEYRGIILGLFNTSGLTKEQIKIFKQILEIQAKKIWIRF